MDISERLSISLAIEELATRDPLSCDALVSAFVAALKTHRRGSVCRPLPAHIQPWDKQAVAAELDQLPALPWSAEGLQAASGRQLQILQWLLLHLQLKQPGSLCTVSPAAVCTELQEQLPSLLQQDVHSCRCILQLRDGRTAARPAASRRLAAHGTAFENLHSILHHGLLAASGTRLQTSGALYGSGVYLSSEFSVAYAFSHGAEGWVSSSIGRRLRCVLLCEVDEAAAGAAGSRDDSLPQTYILVPRPQDVTVRYVLVYSDDAMLGRSRQGHRMHRGAAVCLALTVAYLMMMVVLSWRPSSRSRFAEPHWV